MPFHIHARCLWLVALLATCGSVPRALAEPPQLRLDDLESLSVVRPVSGLGASLPETNGDENKPRPQDRPWYERLNVRGYTQVRYNRLPSFDRNDDLINAQGDRSIGGGNGFLIRRARLILYGDVHERVYIYLQPDFASWVGEQGGAVIVRDWYADLYLSKDKSWRLRVGQSKVPYGFENMQSSQNRLALDRNDALNSAVKDERDLGAILYWAPPHIRQRFAKLVSGNLKGSGDYGVVGLGIYNGQTANQPSTENLHVVGRLAYPFKFGSQFVEVNAGGYYGRYGTRVAPREDVEYRIASEDGLLIDARAYGALVIYPQPIGFVVEATVGKGPQQGFADPTVIDSRMLKGGYAQLMFKIDDFLGTYSLIPYARATYYDGGKKFMVNAPRYEIRELELGLEWQLNQHIELTGAYMIADRTSDRFPYDREQGHVTRVQLQFNY